MVAFFATGYRVIELAVIYRCRLSLQVYSMAIIVTMDGQTVKPHILQGKVGPCLNTVKWPTQGNPTQTDWRMWKDGLQRIITKNNQWISICQWTHLDEPSWFYSQLNNAYSKR